MYSGREFVLPPHTCEHDIAIKPEGSFIQIWYSHLVGIEDELIRFW